MANTYLVADEAAKDSDEPSMLFCSILPTLPTLAAFPCPSAAFCRFCFKGAFEAVAVAVKAMSSRTVMMLQLLTMIAVRLKYNTTSYNRVLKEAVVADSLTVSETNA